MNFITQSTQNNFGPPFSGPAFSVHPSYTYRLHAPR